MSKKVLQVYQNLLSNRGGNYTFRISGQIHHQVPNLKEQDNKGPRFAQIYLYDPPSQLSIRSNMFPTMDEVTVLIVPGASGAGLDNQKRSHRRIQLTTKNDELVFIDQLSSFYDPMAYVLMFINGEHGWSPDSIPLITEQSEEVNEVNQPANEEIEMRRTKYVTAMQYYSYLFQQRPGNSFSKIVPSIYLRSILKN